MKTIFAIYFIILGFAAYGYIENILKLIHACAAPDASVSLMIVLRVIGVITGVVGAIVGYF